MTAPNFACSRRVAWWVLISAALVGHALAARDLTGQWQGTLNVEGGLRSILRITQVPSGGWQATLSSIDQTPQEFPVTSISLEGSTVKFAVELFRAHYEGTLSEDGTVITGQWFGPRTPDSSLPLDYHLATGTDKWVQDASPHKIEFVTVEPGVKLEVLDWGGTGRPLVFLPGLGNDAHVFDKFAPKFTPAYHVYGITRRGFGASSVPEPTNDNYSADRLGDDVLAVIDSLKIDRPVLAGHSIAGGELSSIGSRHPEKVAGLIYLDAAYGYAFYDQVHGDFEIDLNAAKQALTRLDASSSPRDSKRLAQELLKTDLPQLTKSLEQLQRELDAQPDTEPSVQPSPNDPTMKPVRAIMAGEQKYNVIKCPVLAFFAIPSASGPGDKPGTGWSEPTRAWQAAQIQAFEMGVPTAQVVRLQNADHYVFKSNETEVEREMNAFLSKLP